MRCYVFPESQTISKSGWICVRPEKENKIKSERKSKTITITVKGYNCRSPERS